jgi:hypothetical protein
VLSPGSFGEFGWCLTLKLSTWYFGFSTRIL